MEVADPLVVHWYLVGLDTVFCVTEPDKQRLWKIRALRNGAD